jgi:hypothetical protein
LKRNIADVLRRGVASTLANWPVIVTRIVETAVLFGVMIIAVIGAVVPPLVSAGIKEWTLPAGNNPAEVVLRILGEHAALFAYLFVFLCAIALAILAIHSVVTAGATRIYVDADRAAPDAPELRREQFAVFTMERWSAGARAWWLRIFWIYNGAWGFSSLVFLLPLLIVMALLAMAINAESTAGLIAASCGGLALLALVAIPLGIVTAMWAQKAVVICVARDTGAREALRSGWRETRADFLRHFVVFFLIAIVSAGASAVASTLFAPLSFPMRPDGGFSSLLFGPMHIVSMAAQSAISSAVGLWMIAAFAAMTEGKAS